MKHEVYARTHDGGLCRRCGMEATIEALIDGECPGTPDSTPTEREAGDVGEVAAKVAAAAVLAETKLPSVWDGITLWLREDEVEVLAAALAPLIAERERAAGARALREADVVLIDDDTAIGLAMQENALLAGLRGPWEVVTPREHWRLYRRMAPENAQEGER